MISYIFSFIFIGMGIFFVVAIIAMEIDKHLYIKRTRRIMKEMGKKYLEDWEKFTNLI